MEKKPKNKSDKSMIFVLYCRLEDLEMYTVIFIAPCQHARYVRYIGVLTRISASRNNSRPSLAFSVHVEAATIKRCLVHVIFVDMTFKHAH